MQSCLKEFASSGCLDYQFLMLERLFQLVWIDHFRDLARRVCVDSTGGPRRRNCGISSRGVDQTIVL